MKALGDGDTAPLIFNIGTTRKWLVCHTSRLLYPRGQIPPHPLDRSLSGPLNFLERNWRLPKIEPELLDRAHSSIVTLHYSHYTTLHYNKLNYITQY